MAQTATYWDPANLLQVLEDDYRGGEIQCVGRKPAYNQRCRWGIPPHHETTVCDTLRRWASRRPGDITRDELRQLAHLCLCANYHTRQVEDVTRRWAGVVRRAADQRDRLVAEARTAAAAAQNASSSPPPPYQQLQMIQQQQQRLPTPESEDAVALKLELAGLQAQARQADAERQRLEHALAVAQLQGAGHAEHARSLGADLRAAQDKVELVEKGYVQLRAMLAMTQKEHEAAGRRAIEAEGEVEGLRERLKKAEGEKAGADARVEEGRGEVERLGRDLGSLRKKNETLLADYDAVIDKLRSAEVEVNAGREKCQDLKEENEKLSDTHNATLGKLRSVEAEVDTARDEVQRLVVESEKLHLERDSAVENLSKAETEAQGAHEKTRLLTKDNEQLRDAHNTTLDRLRILETEVDAAQGNAEILKTENEKLRLENNGITTRLRNAEGDAEGARSETRCFAADLKARDASLEQFRRELGDERSRNAQLQDEVSALGLRASVLQASITACELHGLGVWFGRQSKKLTRAKGAGKRRSEKGKGSAQMNAGTRAGVSV